MRSEHRFYRVDGAPADPETEKGIFRRHGRLNESIDLSECHLVYGEWFGTPSDFSINAECEIFLRCEDNYLRYVWWMEKKVIEPDSEDDTEYSQPQKVDVFFEFVEYIRVSDVRQIASEIFFKDVEGEITKTDIYELAGEWETYSYNDSEMYRLFGFEPLPS